MADYYFPLQNIGVGTNEPTYSQQMTLPPSVAKPIGQAVEYVGDFLGLPEGGASEMIAGGPTKNTDMRWYDSFKASPVRAAENTGGNVTSADDLKQALIKSGYNPADAENAANGPDADRLKNEYLGGPKQPSGPSPTEVFLQQNPNSDIGKYGMDPGEFTRLIDENYSAGMSMISQLEGNAASIRDADLADVAGAEATGKQLIESQRAEGQQILDTGKKESYDRKEDVVSAARRLYNEAQQGTRQKFGGMTSAGGAVKELLSREFFSNVGEAKKSYSAAMDEIRGQAMKLANDVANKAQELATNVATWKRDAVRNFQTNIANIAQQKYALESERNQAKLGLLEKFRNESMQIAAAEKQYQQQLQLMKEQAASQIGQATSTVNSTLENLLKNTNTDPQTRFKLPGTSGTATSALTGRIGRDDEMTGVVTPISKYNPSSENYWMR